MRSLNPASGLAGRRRLCSNHGTCVAGDIHRRTHAVSRLHAAETLGPSVDELHVSRRSLTQSLELDGSAPDGHPDSTAAAATLAAAARRRRTPAAAVVGSSSSSNGASASSSSSRGRIRRLKTSPNGSSSSSRYAAEASSSSSNGHNSHTAPEHPQQQQQHASPAPAAAAGTQPAAATTLTVTTVSNVTSTSDDDGYDTDASAKELQAEFHEANCPQDVIDIVTDEVARFSPFHTVTALNRLAKLSRGLPWERRRDEVLAAPAFLQLLARLLVQAGELSPFQLSTSLYSCAVLQVPLEQISVAGVPQLLTALESAIAAQAAAFNDRDVSSTLYAYAQLKLRRQPSQAVITLLCQTAQSLVDRGVMSGQSLSMSLWALATLGANSAASHSLAAAAARVLREPSTSFDALGSQGVANSLWAAAKLRQHDAALLAKGSSWLADNLRSCKLQEVLNILWAAGAGRHRPQYLGRIAKHVASQAQALKPADVASLFHVLGIFGFDLAAKPELLEALLPRAAALLPQMKPYEATSLYWGLGMTRLVNCDLFRQLTATISALQQRQLAARQQLEELAATAAGQQQQAQVVQKLQKLAGQLPESLQRQAFQAYIAARLEDVPLEVPGEVLEEWRAAWLAGNSSSSSSGGRRQQRQQQQQQPMLADMGWMLRQLGVKGRIGVRSRLDGLLPVDVELQASGQRLVVVQVLDEHSTDTDGSRLASVLWEEDVLRRNGYDDVFWLRLADWKRVPSERRLRFFVELLRKLGINPQERLVEAAEAAWAAGGRGSGGSGGGSGVGVGGVGSRVISAEDAAILGSLASSIGLKDAGLTQVGNGGITASEVDILMQDGRGRSGGAGGGGGWSSGGKGSRSSRRLNNKRR